MKETFAKNYSFVLAFILIVQFCFSQTDEQRREITSNYDKDYLIQLSKEYEEYFKKEQRKAFEYALQNNIETMIEDQNGGVAFLQQVLDDGTLLYLSTFNDASAVTINTNNVHSGGDRNLDLDGSDFTMGIWDGGLVRLSHQEFTGRITQLDNPSNNSSHATHVSGTMIAAGIVPSARGMAYKGLLSAYSFNNDTAEMAVEASNGMLISNHSYGLSPGQLPDAFFGAYINSTRDVDQITFSAPYYLPVFAAGNSRNNGPSSGGPHNSGKNGYDLISGKNLAKNILCVANVISVPNYTGPSSVSIWTTSSFGPTDDGRIKPDIAAQGRSVFSSESASDTSYGLKTGTSMAAPAVSGSLALLQQHNFNMYGFYLTAASLRTLAIHTAREAGGFPGPDYEYGWGLMDTAVASDMITNKDFTTILEENTLNDADMYTFTVEALDPSIPLVATIAWTDPPGTIQDTSVADDPTPRLVNDLDIRITDQNGTISFPWKLDPFAPSVAATQGDNLVDNVEKIEIINPTGTYTVEVSHKGTLQNLEQDYSIIMSGVKESELSVVAVKASEVFCGNDTAVFQLNVNSVPSFSGNISLTQTGLPSSMLSSFVPATINDSGSTTLFITDLDTVSAGDYPFTVTATSGAFSSSFDLTLTVEPATALTTLTIVGPIAGGDDTNLNPTLEWSSDPDATGYELEISTTQNFDSIIQSIQTTQTIYQTEELDVNTDYFWRVRPFNDCVIGAFTSSDFSTKDFTCAPLFTATDTPIVIPNDSVNQIQSTITISDAFLGFQIEDINVHLNITHTWFSNLTVTLTSPSGTSVILLDGQCDEFDNANVVIDDKGSDPSCNASPPTLSGTIKGIESLSAFKNEAFNGIWTLTVADSFNQDGGSLDNFELEICYEDFLSVENQLLSQFKIYPNPSTDIVNISMPEGLNTVDRIEVLDMSGRQVDLLDVKEVSFIQLNTSNYNSGIYLVKVNTSNTSFVKKLIVK